MSGGVEAIEQKVQQDQQAGALPGSSRQIFFEGLTAAMPYIWRLPESLNAQDMPEQRPYHASTNLARADASNTNQAFANSSFVGMSASRVPGATSERVPPGGLNDSFATSAHAGPLPTKIQTAGLGNVPDGPSANLSGLVCNVQKTTGQEPPPLVGASTTILWDKLYVFGGRRLTSARTQLTHHLYELDLIKRHWTRLETNGAVPLPRYFHSMCALGDSKLVCYGGMAPLQTQKSNTAEPSHGTSNADQGTTVMSDVHIFDIPTSTWTHIPTKDSPPGRYAHCAAVLPSSAVFSSNKAPLSAIQHNPPSTNPNQGTIGVSIDGRGGAELVVVGGQDATNRYIEQISVFNLRSLQWTTPTSFGRSCGAYRSVAAPLVGISPAQVGSMSDSGAGVDSDEAHVDEDTDSASSLLIYSNFNFLDVKLELQIRSPDGTLTEKEMNGDNGPPGLRFPNGGILSNHFVVSGTYMTSTRQEYMLWALDLRTLVWSRIDVGGGTFGVGSWNRGVLWNQRNCFVVLGNRGRDLYEDYNQRRLNFSHICLVELESFGLYEKPHSTATAYVLSGPATGANLGGAFERLGRAALTVREVADMDFLAIGGERTPVNSTIVARRWGPYFAHLLQQQSEAEQTADSDVSTLQPPSFGGSSVRSRNSGVTITPSVRTTISETTTAVPSSSAASISSTIVDPRREAPDSTQSTSQTHPPSQRSRVLFLPHTHPTVRALVYYLYTSSLPPSNTPLCTPQILCSMLQLATPYRVAGLLEATVERLHQTLDARNTAAIFNAAAMAAGKGDSIRFQDDFAASLPASDPGASSAARASPRRAAAPPPRDSSEDEDSSASASASASTTDVSGSESSGANAAPPGPSSTPSRGGALWRGEMSAVVGLQKRGLRGLMEGRRLRERNRSDAATNASGFSGGGGHAAGEASAGVGLGIG